MKYTTHTTVFTDRFEVVTSCRKYTIIHSVLYRMQMVRLFMVSSTVITFYVCSILLFCFPLLLHASASLMLQFTPLTISINFVNGSVPLLLHFCLNMCSDCYRIQSDFLLWRLSVAFTCFYVRSIVSVRAPVVGSTKQR